MKYIDVKWLQNNSAYPIRLVSELNSDGYETRKIEFFYSGRVGYASESAAHGGTQLGKEPIPSVQHINSQGEFEAKETDVGVFEALWKQHAKHGT